MMSLVNDCKEIQVSIIATIHDDNAKLNGINGKIENEELVSHLDMAHLNLEV
jgi:hypothetical protein